MKYEGWSFCWNYLVTFSDGKSFDIMHDSGPIRRLREAFEKHEISISNATLYRMRRPKDRTYGVGNPPELSFNANRLISNPNDIVGWHLQMGRRLD